MCEVLTRQEAYDKIINTYISQMNEEQKIDCCLHWAGFKRNDNGYVELAKKTKEILAKGSKDAKDMLMDLIKSAKLYKLTGTTNTYLQALLRNEYQIIGDIEERRECKCCHYLSIINLNLEKHCPVCGWSDDANESLEEAQKRFAEKGHIVKQLSKEEREINALKYIKVE